MRGGGRARRGPDHARHTRGRSRPLACPLRIRNSSRIAENGRAERPSRVASELPLLISRWRPPPQMHVVRGGVMSSERRIDVSSIQVAASVMAAVTGALAASFLGVAGTIIGTAMMSVAGTMGVALYRYFLDRSREKIHSVASAKIQPLAQGRGVPAVLGHHQVPSRPRRSRTAGRTGPTRPRLRRFPRSAAPGATGRMTRGRGTATGRMTRGRGTATSRMTRGRGPPPA